MVNAIREAFTNFKFPSSKQRTPEVEKEKDPFFKVEPLPSTSTAATSYSFESISSDRSHSKRLEEENNGIAEVKGSDLFTRNTGKSLPTVHRQTRSTNHLPDVKPNTHSKHVRFASTSQIITGPKSQPRTQPQPRPNLFPRQSSNQQNLLSRERIRTSSDVTRSAGGQVRTIYQTQLLSNPKQSHSNLQAPSTSTSRYDSHSSPRTHRTHIVQSSSHSDAQAQSQQHSHPSRQAHHHPMSTSQTSQQVQALKSYSHSQPKIFNSNLQKPKRQQPLLNSNYTAKGRSQPRNRIEREIDLRNHSTSTLLLPFEIQREIELNSEIENRIIAEGRRLGQR